MRNYELLCMLKAGFDIENVDQVITSIENSVKNLGGNIADCNKIGRKKLAYEIKGNRDSFCVTFNMEIAPDKLTELKRILKLNDSVLRNSISLLKTPSKVTS